MIVQICVLCSDKGKPLWPCSGEVEGKQWAQYCHRQQHKITCLLECCLQNMNSNKNNHEVAGATGVEE